MVNAREAPFDFLGYTFGPRHYPKDGVWYLGAAPSTARVRRLRKKVHSTLRCSNQDPIDEVIADLNRLLIGWSNYFSYGTVSKTYRTIDQYVADRLRRFLMRRHKGKHQGKRRFPDARLYQEYGLHRLQGAWVW